MAEASISTQHGTFSLDAAAYGAGIKLGEKARCLEDERSTRDAVYLYFINRPDELIQLVNIGWLKPEDISQRVK